MNRIGVVKCPSPRRWPSRVEWTREAFNHWIDDGHVTQICSAVASAPIFKLLIPEQRRLNKLTKNNCFYWTHT